MKSWKAGISFIVILILVSACGHGKKQVASEQPQPGRDKELFEQGLTEFQKHHYIQGRLLLNTLINTYPDSPFLAMAKLANADSFYAEGTTEALAQAEVEYKDFANFFPTHPFADDALLHVGYIKMRQIQAPNRDQTNTRMAEKALLALLQRYPNTNLKEEIQRRLKDVREVLAEHEMEVARLYMKREQPKGARGRLGTVTEQYPDYTKLDEALFRLGIIYFENEQDPERASKYLTQLVRQFPDSPYRKKAAEMIETMGKPIPEAEIGSLPTSAPRERRGVIASLFSGMKELIGSPDMDVPKEGVLLKQDESAEQLIATAKEYSNSPTTVTPSSSQVSVGSAGAVSAGAQPGAQGKQELRVGAPPDSNSNAGSTSGGSSTVGGANATGPTGSGSSGAKASDKQKKNNKEEKPKSGNTGNEEKKPF